MISSGLALNARAFVATWRAFCFQRNALPAERNKTLTALANTEPLKGAQRKEAQSLQWFLSESGWDPREVNERRLELLFAEQSARALLLRARRASWS